MVALIGDGQHFALIDAVNADLLQDLSVTKQGRGPRGITLAQLGQARQGPMVHGLHVFEDEIPCNHKMRWIIYSLS